MNIIIIGAGDIGLHVATIFSQVDYGIVLIDINGQKLESAARDLDVGIRLGSGTNWQLLEELKTLNPDLLIALTDDDETNLVACTIAKNLGYPRTIARVRNPQYFNHSRLNFEKLFCVDHLIGPEKITADALSDMILMPGSIATENFAHGTIQMRTLKIPADWNRPIPLSQSKKLGLPPQLMVGLIRRQTLVEQGKHKENREQIIFPHGHDLLLAGDEVTFIGETEAIHSLPTLFNIPHHKPHSVMIVGGSLVGINLAQTLHEHHLRVRIIDHDYEKCKKLSELLPYATVLYRNGCDLPFLRSERVEETDVFVACTRSDEVNFLAATIARHLGCPQVLISLSDTSYISLISQFGVSQAASPRVMATNRILSIAREETIASMVSMYGNQAEIMEVKVSNHSKVTEIPIRELSHELPRDLLIVMVHRQGKVHIADGDQVLHKGDTVVVISNPRYAKEIKQLF